MPFPAFMVHFSVLKDPRIERTKLHSLMDILTIALCAVLCGAEGWEDMQAFGEAKEDLLRHRLGLSLPNGIPSEDTFRRVFARLDPEEFGSCFREFVETLHTLTKGEVIALDGKTLRHSFDTATGLSAIHMVSAWASGSGLSLGAVKVKDKSNEITAIPALLKLLEIEGCLITIDAIGCQKAIAKQIIHQKGDYLLGLKGNQETLHKDVQLFFEEALQNDFYSCNPDHKIAYRYLQTIEKDHGRIETRRHWVVEGQAIDWLAQKQDWAGLQSIIRVERQRRIGEKVTNEVCYYISSLCGSVKKVARGVRAHWGIENRLHYVLDVAFGEDDSPICKDHAPQNFATLRHLALNLLKQEKTSKSSIKARRKLAAWDQDYLFTVLTN